MADLAKWALLVAGAVGLVALILSLPFAEYINVEEFAAALANVIDIASDAFRFGRGLVNCFLLPFGRKVVSGLMFWVIGKWAILNSIKIGAWVYHFIFK